MYTPLELAQEQQWLYVLPLRLFRLPELDCRRHGPSRLAILYFRCPAADTLI
jgi:hypothetical protein